MNIPDSKIVGVWTEMNPSTYDYLNKTGRLPSGAINVTTPTGLKFDTEKNPLELLDPLALEGIGMVLKFGSNKYAAHNWRGGISFTRLIGAALRHLFAIIKGEDVDPESGLPHVDHLGCCVMFLSNMMKTRPDLDDRWKKQ